MEKAKSREHVYIREKAVRVNLLSFAAACQGSSQFEIKDAEPMLPLLGTCRRPLASTLATDRYWMEAAVSRLIFSHSPRMMPSRICAGVFFCRLIPYA